MLDTGYLMLDKKTGFRHRAARLTAMDLCHLNAVAGCWILDAGYWILVTGY
jgi:hypothetical protein